MVAKMHFCYNCGKATMCFLFCKKEMFAKCTLNIFLCKMYAKHFPLENVRQNRFLHCLCFLLRKKHSSTKHSSTKSIFVPTRPFARRRYTKYIFAPKTNKNTACVNGNKKAYEKYFCFIYIFCM